ncbi:MAG: hypothetical protein SGJ21_07185 [Alphaproteobacteria bacterium]|nr:hypothetical protein [Alphaproteobacteria bacterium]
MAPALRVALVAAGLGAAMASAPAFAADDVAGEWLFDTSTFNGDCKIKGFINFRPTSLKNTYTCTFESEQICGKQNGNLYIKVKQSCTAQKVGKQVAIKSKVDKVVERRPPNPPEWAAEDGYLADNFIVSLTKSLTEMVGGHYDEQRELAARFWRDIELIS